MLCLLLFISFLVYFLQILDCNDIFIHFKTISGKNLESNVFKIYIIKKINETKFWYKSTSKLGSNENNKNLLFQKATLNPSLKLFCEFSNKFGWTIIMRRNDDFKLKFNKNWNDFKKGFGDIENEFFLGLENIYLLTNQPNKRFNLLIVLKNDEKTITQTIKNFKISNEKDGYKLTGIPYINKNILSSPGLFQTADRMFTKAINCFKNCK